jgi:hypothetical protein
MLEAGVGIVPAYTALQATQQLKVQRDMELRPISTPIATQPQGMSSQSCPLSLNATSESGASSSRLAALLNGSLPRAGVARRER